MNQSYPQNIIVLDGYSGNSFGDKISFTVGISYLLGGVFGLAQGVKQSFPINKKMPRQIIIKNIINTMSLRGVSCANHSAGAAAIFYLLGYSLNFLLEDELEDIDQRLKNVMVGVLAGGIFKSTKGLKSVAVGAAVGGTLIGLMDIIMEELNERDIIGFNLKV